MKFVLKYNENILIMGKFVEKAGERSCLNKL